MCSLGALWQNLLARLKAGDLILTYPPEQLTAERQALPTNRCAELRLSRDWRRGRLLLGEHPLNHVRIHAAAVETRSSPPVSADDQPHKAPRGSGRSPPGRPRAPVWNLIEPHVIEWLDENGVPDFGDGKQTELEAVVAGLLLRRKHPATESVIRMHVKRWMKEYAARAAL
jgi:hypothetical protein